MVQVLLAKNVKILTKWLKLTKLLLITDINIIINILKNPVILAGFFIYMSLASFSGVDVVFIPYIFFSVDNTDGLIIFGEH